MDFYAANAQFPVVTNLKQAEPFAALLSRVLYQSMKSALEADEAYLKKNPTDKGYFGDGLSFIGNPEGYTSYSIKKVTSLAPNAAKVEVRFSYVDKRKPKKWSSTWTNVLLLTLENKRWVIDDIEYLDGGRLSFDLKKAIEVRRFSLFEQISVDFKWNLCLFYAISSTVGNITIKSLNQLSEISGTKI